jgi:hypothetical protein
MTCLHVLFNIERIHPIPRLIQETVEILVIQICVSIGAGCILSCSLAFCRFLHLGPIHFCKIYYKVFGSLKFFITLCFSCAFSQELKTEIIIFTQSWLCSWRSSYEYRNHTSLSQKEIELVKIGYHRAERTGQKLWGNTFQPQGWEGGEETYLCLMSLALGSDLFGGKGCYLPSAGLPRAPRRGFVLLSLRPLRTSPVVTLTPPQIQSHRLTWLLCNLKTKLQNYPPTILF